jgi:hypothetical protein
MGGQESRAAQEGHNVTQGINGVYDDLDDAPLISDSNQPTEEHGQ